MEQLSFGEDEVYNLTKERSFKVVKSNDLIQKARFDLNAQQQKIIYWLISKIQPDDTELKTIDFKLIEFCKICGINYNSGTNYKQIKDAIKKLADKSVWVKTENGAETLVRWIEKPIINNGTVKLKIDDDMKPFLINLKQQFTQFELYNVLPMKGKYSMRLYELFKSFQKLTSCSFKVDDLKQNLLCENYKRYPDFKRKVIVPAIEEINTVTDISVSFIEIKEGRKVVKLKFFLSKAENPNRRILTAFERLNPIKETSVTE